MRAADGVRVEARYEPYAGPAHRPDQAVEPPEAAVTVLAHGFTGSLDRPALRRAARVFAQHTAVITFSFRGHGRSGGRSTVGDLEVLDLAAAVGWARSLGHRRVTTVGFSMGGSVVIRHGALYHPDAPEEREGRTGAHADTVVAISAPARWFYRGTAPMRRVHQAIESPVGRLVSRFGLRTRIHPADWDPVPLSPVDAAPLIAPTPLLIVHGDQDPYFPLDHPRSLATAAGATTTAPGASRTPDTSGTPTASGHAAPGPSAGASDPAADAELWIVPGFGHAENAARPELLHRVAAWTRART
ncbi:alpha/beta fold hydrolase [Streptomyces sp. AJS327]|nr:alpha/beta fold hydrolase [Streptomyces sp. AJS327]